MSSFLLVLSILLPLAGGFLVLPLQFHDSRKRMIYCQAVVCLTSLLVWYLILTGSARTVPLYRFSLSFTVALRMDGMSKLFAGMVSFMWPLVLLYSSSYMEKAQRQNLFYAFFVMAYGITLGVAFSANMVSMHLFFEMLTLVTIPLVAHYGDHDSLYAGRLYAAFTIGGASLALFPVIFSSLYGRGGNFLFGGSLAGQPRQAILQAAFLFGFFGFGAKAAVFPLSRWLPTASVAPTPVTALLHAVAVVNSGVFAVIRMSYYVFGPQLLQGTIAQSAALATAAFSLLFGAVMALRERHFKRRLAWSTMSNLSYMLLGAMLLTPEGMAAGLTHMLFHGIIKITLFMCAGAFMVRTGKNYLFEINGVGRKMPVTFACYTLGALSLTGIPLLCGFVSKWQLVTAAIRQGTPLAVGGAVCLIISAFLCAVYSLSISVRAFFTGKEKDLYRDTAGSLEAGPAMLVPVLVFSVLDLLFGMWSAPVLSFLGRISAGLL